MHGQERKTHKKQKKQKQLGGQGTARADAEDEARLRGQTCHLAASKSLPGAQRSGFLRRFRSGDRFPLRVPLKRSKFLLRVFLKGSFKGSRFRLMIPLRVPLRVS